VSDFISDTVVETAPLTADIGESQAGVVDAFDGGVKDAPLPLDTVQFAEDVANLLEDASVGEAIADLGDMTLLEATELVSSHADEVQLFVDTQVMPVITTLAEAAAEGTPVTAELVAEVLVDALSGGAEAGMSIDDLLSALPSADSAPAILAGLSTEFSADALMPTVSEHFSAFSAEASFLVQHDSVSA